MKRKSISIDDETEEILKPMKVKNLSKLVRGLVKGDARIDVKTNEENNTKTYILVYKKWKIQ